LPTKIKFEDHPYFTGQDSGLLRPPYLHTQTKMIKNPRVYGPLAGVDWTQQPQDRSLRRAYMKTECAVGFNNSRLYVKRLRNLPALRNYLHRLCNFSNRKVQLINPLTPQGETEKYG